MTVGATSYPTSVDDATSLIRVVNLASSTIDTGGVNSSATTIPVVSTALAPSDGIAWCGLEAIAYTGKTATSLTGCTRHVDNTATESHAAGDPILFDAIIAARFTVLQNAIINLETAVGITDGVLAPRTLRDRGGAIYNLAAYGAALDGTTNDATIINSTITTANSAGGGDVVIPPGKIAAISASVVLKNNVRLVISSGAELKWTGAAGGTMITDGGVDPLQRSGVIGSGLINAGGSFTGLVLDLSSPQSGDFGGYEVYGTTSTATYCKVRADATNASGYESTRNAVFSRYGPVLVRSAVSYVYDIGGTTGNVVTLNTFRDTEATAVHTCGFRLLQWVDNNFHQGYCRIELAANNAGGVIFNDTATPLVDAGVYSNNFTELAVDDFGTRTGVFGVRFNKGKGNIIRFLHCDPSLDNPVHDVSGDSYFVVTKQPGSYIDVYEKGYRHQSNTVYANNTGLYGQDTAGTDLRLISMGNDNVVRVGTGGAAASNGHVMLYSGGVEGLRVNPGGTITVQTVATFAADPIIPDEAYDATAWNGSLEPPTKNAVRDKIEAIPALTDGDKGDVTVSSSGTVWTVDNDVVTYAKMQNVSATDRVLGRSTAGAGDVEEITLTAAGRALIDDANAAAQIATLGLDADLATFSLPASTTISAFGKTLVDDADAATALATLGAAASSHTHTTTLSKDIPIGDGTNVIPAGVYVDVRFPFAATITKWSIAATKFTTGTTGSVTFDLWKDTYANFPPVVGDSITASAKPTLTTAAKAESSTLTGWTTSVAAGDIIRVNVDATATAVSLCTLTLEFTRTV